MLKDQPDRSILKIKNVHKHRKVRCGGSKHMLFNYIVIVQLKNQDKQLQNKKQITKIGDLYVNDALLLEIKSHSLCAEAQGCSAERWGVSPHVLQSPITKKTANSAHDKTKCGPDLIALIGYMLFGKKYIWKIVCIRIGLPKNSYMESQTFPWWKNIYILLLKFTGRTGLKCVYKLARIRISLLETHKKRKFYKE